MLAYQLSEQFDGRYRPLDTLPTDDTSGVLPAERIHDGRRVVVHFASGLSRGATMRMEHEISCLRDLRSEFVPTILDADFSDQAVSVVIDDVAGDALPEADLDQLHVLEVIKIARCLFRALSDIHGGGVQHLDVWPRNVIVQDGQARLIRSHLGRETIDTADADQLLRASFLSPEQAGSIERDVAAPADLYSAGAVLFFMLTGRPPFTAEDFGGLLLAHMTSAVPSLCEQDVDIPRALDEIIQRLMRKDPSDRYQTAEAVLYDLDQLAHRLERGEADPKLAIGSQDARNTLTEPSFVARELEVSQILAAMKRAVSGAPSLVALEGESGAGKTRLLVEVAQRAISEGFVVFRGQGSNDNGRGALSVLQGVVDGFLASHRNDTQLCARFRESFDGDPSCLTAQFPKLDAVVESASTAAAAPEGFGEARSLRTLSSFLNALGSADKPALIILDDCQWGDELTYKLLERWRATVDEANQPRHVVLLVSYRAEEVGAEHPLRRLDVSTQVCLSSLPAKDIHLLAESMAGQLPLEVLQFIANVSAGSPFMAAAVLRGLVETGAIVHTGESWQVDALAFSDCQSSSRAAAFLTRRLELLDETTIRLLSAGAILGKEFDLDAATYLTDDGSPSIYSKFDEARRRHLVWIRGDGRRCAFSHDKIRETLLARLDQRERRAMHLQAAEYLLSRPDPKPLELAFHFDAAHDPERALPYAMQAAEDARAQYSLEVAKRQYLIALRAVQAVDDDMRYRIEEGLGDVLMLRGEYDAAEVHFMHGAELAQGAFAQAQIRGKLAELARKRGDMERAIGDYETALRTLGHGVPRHLAVYVLLIFWEAAVQSAHTLFPSVFLHRLKREPNASERLGLRLFSGLAHAYFYGRGKPMVLWAHLRGVNQGERFLPTLELANAYSEHAPAMSLLTLFQRAFRYAAKSFEIRRSFGDLWGQGQSLSYYGCALYAASQFEECIAKCREAVRLLERTGDYWQVHIARYQIAASLYHLGRVRDAIDEVKKNYKSGLDTGDEQASGIIFDVWARATGGHAPTGLLDVEVARDRFDAQGTAQVLIGKCVNLLQEGETSQAYETIQKAITVAENAGVANCYSIPAYAWHLHTLRRLAEGADPLNPRERGSILRRARQSARRALRVAWLCRNDLPQVLRDYAMVAAMSDRPKKARGLLRRSIQAANRHNAAFEFAESMRVYGELGEKFGWHDAGVDAQEAQTLLSKWAIESGFGGKESPDQAVATLSLADRFDNILDVGRRITAALSESDVYEQTRIAALRLLRCEHCVVVESRQGRHAIVAGDAKTDLDRKLIRTATKRGRVVIEMTETASEFEEPIQGSVLCVPIFAVGEARAVVYATHAGIRNLYGQVEERLAYFIAAIAGASLERAHGYTKLQELNETLEERVTERTRDAEMRARELAASNRDLERTANELRATEEQLRVAIEEANAANEAKTQFLTTISHEIRTPMNGILGMTELAMRTSLTPQQESCLRVVKQSGDTLLLLLNDVLDLSKIEAGKMELEVIEFDLREVVEGVIQLMSVAAYKKGLELVCEISNETPQFVGGDPTRLRQVLVNLVGNAIKFTKEGEIHLLVHTNSEGGCCFSVRDTGIGIPEDKQQLVFEAFRQSDNSTTRKYGGTGLGLSICQTIVELMGGQIELESESGVGSTFSFTIHFEDERHCSSAIQSLRGRGAALVGSNPRLRRAHKLLLESLGMHVMDVDQLADIDAEDCEHFDIMLFDGPSEEQLEAAQTLPLQVVALMRPSESLACPVPQITKPVTQEELRKVLVEGLDGAVVGPTVEPEVPPTDSWSILLADDSVVNQEVAVGLLEFYGHQVAVANNGSEAVQLANETRFDVILMDLEMPEMDGYEATRVLRQSSQCDAPIIAMTAHAVPAIEQKCREAGMVGYVSKPVDPPELLEELARVVKAAHAQNT